MHSSRKAQAPSTASTDSTLALWGLAATALCAGATQLVGCSSDFSSCEARRNCPSVEDNAGAAGEGESAGASGSGGAAGGAGTGGDAGDAGASGSTGMPLPVACTTTADCDDGLACNGTETCSAAGLCASGEPPCSTADAAHCIAVCTEAGATPTCSVQGTDQDKDGHRSNACAAAPGDDCDDAAATVFTGAPELCDGIDNDCDGKLDLDDGLNVSGTTVELGPAGATRASPSIAWAPEKSLYGISYIDLTTAGKKQIYFETVDPQGQVVTAPLPFGDVSNQSSTGSIAWGGDSFGAAWSDDEAVRFRTVASNGAVGPVRYVAGGTTLFPRVARAASGNWAVAYILFKSATYVNLNTISAGGSVGPAKQPYEYAHTSPSLAGNGNGFLLTYFTGSDVTDAVAEFWSVELGSPRKLSIAGSSAVVGGGASGFAVVANQDGPIAPKFYSFDANGTLTCGPVEIADVGFRAVSIASSSSGYLAVSDTGRLQQVSKECKTGPVFSVGATAGAFDFQVTAGDAGYGVVWSDATGTATRRRLFGAKICN